MVASDPLRDIPPGCSITERYLVHGLKVAVTVSQEGMLERIGHRLPPGSAVIKRDSPEQAGGRIDRPVDRSYTLTVAPEPGLEHILDVDGWSLVCNGDVEDLLDFFDSDLEIFVSCHARDRVFVRAGVVAWRGTALVFPGPRGGFTSRLVAALLQEGAVYYSDRFAVLDDEARVHPYPRYLRMRTADGEDQDVTAELLGAKVGTQPLDVGLVVLAEHAPAARWAPRRIPDEDLIRALLRHAPGARKRPAESLAVFKRLALKASGMEGKFAEAASLVAELVGQPAG